MSYVDPQELAALDNDLLVSPELLGAECCACYRILRFKFFERDASYRTGHKPICIDCQAQPTLSMKEHLSRLQLENFHSEAVKRMRHEDQEEWRKESARRGRTLHTSELLTRLHRLVPSLYVQEGGIVNHLALYLVAPGVRRDWDGKNYMYMGFAEFVELPEYSLYEFDEQRDVMIRERERGWRDILLKFIRAGVLTEEQADKEFGKPTGQASVLWYKKLWNQRNLKQTA